MDARALGFQAAMIKCAVSDRLIERTRAARSFNWQHAHWLHKQHAPGSDVPRDFQHPESAKAVENAYKKMKRNDQRFKFHSEERPFRERAMRARAARKGNMALAGAAAATALGAGLIAHHVIKKRREQQKTAGAYAGTLPNPAARKRLLLAGGAGAALGVAGAAATMALLRRRRTTKPK